MSDKKIEDGGGHLLPTTLSLSSLGNVPELKLHMAKWIDASGRLHESKHVIPATYSELEYTYQEAWRESRTNAIVLEDAINKTKRYLEEIKADIILDDIPRIIEEKGLSKSQNNSDLRNAVIARDENFKAASEHLGKLQAMLSHFESHMKILENTSRFIKKQMDYFTRSGMAGANMYVTTGKN